MLKNLFKIYNKSLIIVGGSAFAVAGFLFPVFQSICEQENMTTDILKWVFPPILSLLLFGLIISIYTAVLLFKNPVKDIITDNSAEDSLLSMMKEAQSHSHWAEILKIGSALSEVLWFTSRKQLRKEIGFFVELAATQLNDTEALSSALIEDIGNTTLGLGDWKEAKKYIEKGIEISDKNNYHFISSRGYRNLSCCFSYAKDIPLAKSNLELSREKAKSIVDEEKKMEALGAIEYAWCKIFGRERKYDDAIKALDNSVKYYEELSKKYPNTSKRNQDRLVKIYREKGVIYLDMNTPESYEMAYTSLQKGLKLAQEVLNYDNIVRCCNLIVGILIDRNALPSAEGILSIAQKNINKVETKSIKNEFIDMVTKMEKAKRESVK